MRRPVVRALGFYVAGAFVALALIVLGVYAISEWKLRRHRDVPLADFRRDTAPTTDDLAEGERMAVIVGCWAGCHGRVGQGGSDDTGGWYEATAPTLSDVLPRYSDAELVRLIRFGVKRDGVTAIGMVSGTFYALGDDDLGKIIAHLRAQPPSPPVPRDRTIHFSGRWAMVTGEWKTSADEVDTTMPRWGELPHASGFERGRYLVSITCTECHGLDLQGRAVYGSPALDVVAAYDRDQFRHLLRTGEPLGKRDLGIMSWVAREAFRRFTDEEIADIHAYLREYRRAPPTRAAADNGT